MTSNTRIRCSGLAIVDGWRVNVATLDDAVKSITVAAARRLGFTVFTLNLDHLVHLRRHASFQVAYLDADFVTADGAPVVALARRQSNCVVRTTGADLVVPLVQSAAKHKLPIFLFGTTNNALAQASRYLIDQTGGSLEIAGRESPPVGFDPESTDADAAIERIGASGARLCLVALGAPKQELFAARAKARGLRVGFVCIGAALDFLAGEQVRAPKAMQDWNLEWLWRLMTNPRRLTVRYAKCAVLLADLVFVDPLRKRIARQLGQKSTRARPRVGSGARE